MKVLYINKLDKEKQFKVKSCCVMQGIQIVPEPASALPEEAELLKMIDMNGRQVQSFLAALRKLGVRVDLKCVETEHNREWPLEKLYGELREEHAYMKQLEAERRAQAAAQQGQE